MKLSPEDVGTVTKHVLDSTAEKAAEKIELLLGESDAVDRFGQLTDDAYRALSMALEEGIAGALGKFEVTV